MDTKWRRGEEEKEEQRMQGSWKEKEEEKGCEKGEKMNRWWKVEDEEQEGKGKGI